MKRKLLPRYLTFKDTLDQDPSPLPVRQESEINEKVCSKCSPSMVKRVAKEGNHAGKQFYACSAYPKCKTIEAINA